MLKIGVMPDSFRLPFYDGIKRAYDMGAKGIGPWISGGFLAPENMTEQGIAEFKSVIKGYDLTLSAVCGDIGYNFADLEKREESVARFGQLLHHTAALGTKIMTSHIGNVPENMEEQKYTDMVETMKMVAKHAEDADVYFAIETGGETPAVLKQFIENVGSKNVKVNFDPANLVLGGLCNPVDGVYILRDYIVSTHAKDGIRFKSGCEEVPLGTGGVPFPEYLKALVDIGFDGYLTIERETGDNTPRDIQIAYNYLDKLLKELF